MLDGAPMSAGSSSRVATRHRVGELPGDGGRDQPGVRFGADAQRVLGDQPAGVGGVGEHGRLAGEQHGKVLLVVGTLALDDQPPLGQPATDPLAEFGRRLAGEGQPQHAVRSDEPVGDEPHDARRHRLGLARAGAGDDNSRRERRLDHRRLLGRRRGQAEQRRQLASAVITCVTCRPAVCSGHELARSQFGQYGVLRRGELAAAQARGDRGDLRARSSPDPSAADSGPCRCSAAPPAARVAPASRRRNVRRRRSRRPRPRAGRRRAADARPRRPP